MLKCFLEILSVGFVDTLLY